MNVQQIRDKFPILSCSVYGKPLVYLDNAASSQRLDSVVERQSYLQSNVNANIQRAVHYLANQATNLFEQTRDNVKDFIGAAYREEIIFTSGTTASINLVAYSFCEAFVNSGDEIIVSESEHHSNIVPWQLACQRKGASIRIIPVDDTGHLRIESLDDLISDRTKLIAVCHVSNVLGIVNPIADICSKAHSKNIPVLVDGAQGIVHQLIDVQKLGCDFYAFSGHKLYAATGTGVLYGKREYLDKMPPYMGGGEMIGTVSFSGTTYAPLPHKFEAGTQNINAIPTLIDAIDFVNQLNDNELIQYQTSITEYMLDSLQRNPRIRLYGVPRVTSEKIPLFSFSVEGVHHEDLALILDKMGIAVRSGQMCAEPLMDRYGVTGMLRVSFAPYNTMQEAEYFIKSLGKAIEMLS